MSVPSIINKIAPMSDEAISRVALIEDKLRGVAPVTIETDHVIHAGMYARTIKIPAGTVLTGALIKIATMLIVDGDCLVFVGDAKPLTLSGRNVLPASARRKQAFVAKTDTWLTMIFTTGAKTVLAAEDEFTNEGHNLLSRQDAHLNTIKITGE